MEKIEFIASLPPIQSAISLDELGGARVKLDIPEEYIEQVMKLSRLRGEIFKVIISMEKE